MSIFLCSLYHSFHHAMMTQKSANACHSISCLLLHMISLPNVCGCTVSTAHHLHGYTDTPAGPGPFTCWKHCSPACPYSATMHSWTCFGPCPPPSYSLSTLTRTNLMCRLHPSLPLLRVFRVLVQACRPKMASIEVTAAAAIIDSWGHRDSKRLGKTSSTCLMAQSAVRSSHWPCHPLSTQHGLQVLWASW